MCIASAEFSNVGLYRAVYFDGPQPDRDAEGEEIPAWTVYVGDADAEPTGKVYTLRAGDVVEYAGQPCRVIRVSESAAVVAVVQKPRTITPRFGKPVTIQPAPKLERISATSALPVLSRPNSQLPTSNS